MPLSKKQLENVCLLNDKHKKCRYLAQDDIDVSKWFCMKKSSRKSEIDEEVDLIIKEFKSKNVDPKTQNMPLGDNCSGYPILKYLDQGYDCPGT